MRTGVNEYCRPLVGARLIAVERLDHSWFVRLEGDVTVATESLWRLIDDGKVVTTSEDHGQWLGLSEPLDATARLLSPLRNRAVTGAAIAPFGDLAINFGEQTVLQFLQTSCGYESWRLSVPGSETICTGGGEIVHLAR